MNEDPLFHADVLIGRILDALAGVGLCAVVIAVCFIAGYLT